MDGYRGSSVIDFMFPGNGKPGYTPGYCPGGQTKLTQNKIPDSRQNQRDANHNHSEDKTDNRREERNEN